MDLNAIAIELDLVNPAFPTRHLVNQRRQRRFNEAGIGGLDATDWRLWPGVRHRSNQPQGQLPGRTGVAGNEVMNMLGAKHIQPDRHKNKPEDNNHAPQKIIRDRSRGDPRRRNRCRRHRVRRRRRGSGSGRRNPRSAATCRAPRRCEASRYAREVIRRRSPIAARERWQRRQHVARSGSDICVV
jgi:hypothetical protein